MIPCLVYGRVYISPALYTLLPLFEETIEDLLLLLFIGVIFVVRVCTFIHPTNLYIYV